MHKNLVYILCLAILLIKLPTYSATFMTGIKCGLNLATWYGDDVDEQYKVLLPGVITGLGIQTRATEFFTVQLDVLYAQKGVKWKSGNYMNYVRQHFLDFPVCAKFIIPNPSIVKPFGYSGIYLAVTFLSKEKFVYNGEVEHVENVSQYLSRIEFGFPFGGGIDLDFGNVAITFDVRYSLGITSVDEDREADVKNGVLSFLWGISWGD